MANAFAFGACGGFADFNAKAKWHVDIYFCKAEAHP